MIFFAMYSWDFPTKALYYWLRINLSKGEKKVNLLRGPFSLSPFLPPPSPSISLMIFVMFFHAHEIRSYPVTLAQYQAAVWGTSLHLGIGVRVRGPAWLLPPFPPSLLKQNMRQNKNEIKF